ncbi:uncharacterized protein LOC114294046 [Camellia sinensis]|uniref:uncharacterized protein LOC114294046 n=1 Tax=Camellia sinensis TaxID=4442 RepID=UPI001036487F|nr:uncharacterized protein LOC114294046 [Camellia sinensis]
MGCLQMSSFGFQDKWIRWMKACIQSVKVSVLVNGSSTNEFCPEKGLRQGDPLSPFLFNIVAEGLNILFQRAKALELIKGVVIGLRKVNVTHLQFANDTIVFCEAEENDILNVKRILRCFEVLSRLKINFHKSLVCGVGVQEAEVNVFAGRLNCMIQKLPFMYLGLPLEASPRRKSTWLPARFLWGGSKLKKKIHLVKLEEVTKTKHLGGLGIKKLKEVNDCLLAKWWWRYGSEDRVLWKDILISKYGNSGGRWRPNSRSSAQCSRVRSDILRLEHNNSNLFCFFMDNFVIQVGNGKRVRFWEDSWATYKCLKEDFPRFELSVEKEVTIKQMIDKRNGLSEWKLSFRRNLKVRQEVEMERLQSLLLSYDPSLSEKADSLAWQASSSALRWNQGVMFWCSALLFGGSGQIC